MPHFVGESPKKGCQSPNTLSILVSIAPLSICGHHDVRHRRLACRDHHLLYRRDLLGLHHNRCAVRGHHRGDTPGCVVVRHRVVYCDPSSVGDDDDPNRGVHRNNLGVVGTRDREPYAAVRHRDYVLHQLYGYRRSHVRAYDPQPLRRPSPLHYPPSSPTTRGSKTSSFS